MTSKESVETDLIQEQTQPTYVSSMGVFLLLSFLGFNVIYSVSSFPKGSVLFPLSQGSF